MKKNTKFVPIHLAFILMSLSISIPTHATRWPSFVPPDKDLLLKNNYIETKSCPAGQGRLIPGVVINISHLLCKTFCPGNWNWVAQSDGACHSLEHGFSFHHFDIVNHYDRDGTTNYSSVTAFYSDKQSKMTVSFIMNTVKGEYWQCAEENPTLHFIYCTNDI